MAARLIVIQFVECLQDWKGLCFNCCTLLCNLFASEQVIPSTTIPLRVAMELPIDSCRLLHILQLWRGIFMCSDLCNI
jgi:hypothetical protein